MNQLFAFLVTPVGVVTLLVALAAAYIRWRLRSRVAQPIVSETIAELQRLRKRVDHRIAKLGLNRRPGETLTHFAQRIEIEAGDVAAARWYADYSDVRYRDTQSADEIARLRENLMGLGPAPRRRQDVALN
jgi:hypothetical protein